MRRSWIVAGVGAGGVLFSAVLYGWLWYAGFHQRGGVYDRMRAQLAVQMLNNAVREVEFFKVQHNHYPAKLREVLSSDPRQPSSIVDPIAMERVGNKDLYFFYQLDPSGNFYFLRSVGPDGIPFTADDILPSLSPEERKNTGLRLER